MDAQVDVVTSMLDCFEFRIVFVCFVGEQCKFLIGGPELRGKEGAVGLDWRRVVQRFRWMITKGAGLPGFVLDVVVREGAWGCVSRLLPHFQNNLHRSILSCRVDDHGRLPPTCCKW